MEMGEQYGQLPDLSQLMAGGRSTHFPSVVHLSSLFSNGNSNSHHYEMVAMCGGLGEAAAPRSSVTSREYRLDLSPRQTNSSVFEQENSVWDGGNGRWPRQETLTLLEIRSQLDAKFKEANHKGPLWDEVARIMASEHGYQRSGKKCREKFENLYKYYRKTKDGKAGRQDGKHYRFFRQLDALCGENSSHNIVVEANNVANNQSLHVINSASAQLVTIREAQQTQKLCDSLSLSDSSGFEFSSSEEAEDKDETVAAEAFIDNDQSSSMTKKKSPKSLKRGRRSWKSKIREFIDLQIRKLTEMQEAWLERMLATLEHREQERLRREEEWRKQEIERYEREHRSWASERAWIEARDSALMEALQKISQKEQRVLSTTSTQEFHEDGKNENGKGSDTSECMPNSQKWKESEVSSLIKLKSSVDFRYEEGEGSCSERSLWKEISAKMKCLGYDRSSRCCREKWEDVDGNCSNSKDCNKKRKEITCAYFEQLESGACTRRGDQIGPKLIMVHKGSDGSGPCSSTYATTTERCLPFLIANNGESLWESYEMKINGKNDNQDC